jgi:hypothetical protein
MRQELKQIKDLLEKVEMKSTELSSTASPFSGLELPDIIRDAVDLLFPNVAPYEASFYIYMLRNSILENGTPYIRVSSKTLSKAIKSANEGTTKGGDVIVTKISDTKVRVTLESLQSIGAIRKENDPDRNGTLYRVMLPEEIELCQQYRHEISKQAQETKSSADLTADYYNVRENRVKVYERDDYKCKYCQKQLTRFTSTLDHVTPVARGGDNSLENLVTACLDCNSRKNVRPTGDFLAEK